MSLSRKEMIESAPSHRELFEKFSRSLDKGNKQTKQTYLKVLRNYINYLEEKRIEKPDDEDVTAFKQYLSQAPSRSPLSARARGSRTRCICGARRP